LIDSEDVFQKDTFQKFLIAFQAFLEDIMLKPRDLGLSEYLEKIGAISLMGAVDTLVRRYERSYGDTVTDVFLAADVADDETAFGTLWLFSEKYCIQLPNFRHENKTNPIPLSSFGTFSEERTNYERMGFGSVKELYDPTGTLPTARFCVTVQVSNKPELQFKASGRNCDFLLHILDKYIKANKVKS
jgi:hypothetical protein